MTASVWHVLVSAIVGLIFLLFVFPATLSCLYLLFLTLLSGRLNSPQVVNRKYRFDVVVPAHNEQQSIARTVQSLAAIDWPKDLYRILVVADNCTDQTALVAAENGATVLERNDATKRGKGFALLHAFEISDSQGLADAVIVVDADSEVSPNILSAYAARLELGERAVQGHYSTLNPLESWRTRLITIAISAFHTVRSRARERLGLSCGLRGNGWCVTHSLLREVPYRSFSLAEDVEFGNVLGMAGVRVAYADEVSILGEMVSGEQAARKQRQRWEQGRFQLVREQLMPLLGASIKRRDPVTFDLAIDLMVLPLSYLAALVFLMGVLSAILVAYFPDVALFIVSLALFCCLSMLAYVLRGWMLSGTGWIGIADLLRAPFFIVWKLMLLIGGKRQTEWIRTDRESK